MTLNGIFANGSLLLVYGKVNSQVPRNIDTTYPEREVPFWDSPLDIGLILSVVLLVAIYFFYMRWKKNKKAEEEN